MPKSVNDRAGLILDQALDELIDYYCGEEEPCEVMIEKGAAWDTCPECPSRGQYAAKACWMRFFEMCIKEGITVERKGP